MIKPRFYPTDDLPLWIEVDLDMLGVRKPKPKNPTSSSKPADHGSGVKIILGEGETIRILNTYTEE